MSRGGISPGKRRRRSAERIADNAPTLDDARRHKGQWLNLADGTQAMLELRVDGWVLLTRATPLEEPGSSISFAFCAINKTGGTGIGWPGGQLLTDVIKSGQHHYEHLARQRARSRRPVRMSHSLW